MGIAAAGKGNFGQARAAAGVVQAGVEREFGRDVVNRADAGVDVVAGRFAVGEGGVEAVVTQAGGEGDGFDVPNTFEIEAGIGFFLLVETGF